MLGLVIQENAGARICPGKTIKSHLRRLVIQHVAWAAGSDGALPVKYVLSPRPLPR
jgi:hypothetical protein